MTTVASYELAVMGSPSASQIAELESHIRKAVEPFGLQLGIDIAWTVRPVTFIPEPKQATAVIFFGGSDASGKNLHGLLQKGIPILPVASLYSRVPEEIPAELRALNCLSQQEDGMLRIASAWLECVGLLPQQRRVFISYRRTEAREAALQLFDQLSARHFDVFLDTHGIAPAENFQAMLWHHLCDSDVLVMLDTPTYFDSRWTAAEFGRALSKGISVLRIGWPTTTVSKRASTATQLNLLVDQDINLATGELTEQAIANISTLIEQLRSKSHALRSLNLFSRIQQSVEQLGATVNGVGLHRAINITLPDGRDVVLYPTLGIPTSRSLHEATDRCPDSSVAVVYDEVGMHPSWQDHIHWLDTHIRIASYVKSNEVGWTLADWEAA